MAEERKARSGWLARLGAPQVAPPWTITDVAMTLVALLVSMFLIAPSVASLTAGEFLTPRALLFGWMVGLLITTGFVLLNRGRTPEERQALRLVAQTQPSLFFVFVFGIAITLLVDVFVGLPGGGFSPAALLAGISGHPNTDAATWLLAALVAVLVQPIAETLVFFGVVLPRLRASISPWGGYAITVALFTSYHFAAFGDNLAPALRMGYGLLAPALIGAFLGAVRTRTSSTLATLLAYIGVGATTLLAALALQ